MKRRPSGLGTVYLPAYRSAGKLQHSAVYWCSYTANGKRVSVSTGQTKKKLAEDFLRAKIAERDALEPGGRTRGEMSFDNLAAMIRADYVDNEFRTLSDLNLRLKHLGKFFEGPAEAITVERVAAYVTLRRATAKPATVNRELSALRRALRLALCAGKLSTIPKITALKESNARKGFFEADQFEAVLEVAPEYLRPLLVTYYTTGWRKEELLTRLRKHVDLKAGWLRLEPGETKNGRGRMFPLVPRLRAALEAQEEATKQKERLLGKSIPWLFHRAGKPILSFRESWRLLCVKAKVPGRFVHDFRRTAVRNLIRAGVAQQTAMVLVGLETPSMFQRYSISDETMLREAGEKLAKLGG